MPPSLAPQETPDTIAAKIPNPGWIESHPFTFASGQATSMPNGYLIRLFGYDSGSSRRPHPG